jgi:hypothetical protein
MSADEAAETRRDSANQNDAAPPAPDTIVGVTAPRILGPDGHSRGHVVLRVFLMSLSGGSMLAAMILVLIGHAWLAAGVVAGAVAVSVLLLILL